jgi:tRNA (Thr-GGU) A37 N-methylase
VKVELEPIGRVETARQEVKDDFWGGVEARIVLDQRFDPVALDGIEAFSHAEIVFLFDRVPAVKIELGARRPRNNPDWPAVGIFAQRGKNRPNRIGTTICRILGRDGRTLRVAELDAIDGTPVLDVKPVIREFLPRGELRQPAWCSELMSRYWQQEGPEHEG